MKITFNEVAKMTNHPQLFLALTLMSILVITMYG